MRVVEILTEALQLAVPDAAREGAELLKSISDEELQKVVFTCLVYRMDASELKALVSNGASAEDVLRKRNDYIVSLASDQDPVILKAEKALYKAERLEKEQEDIKHYLKDELAQALEMSRTAGERERTVLQRQVDLLTNQIEEAKLETQELKKSLHQKEAQIADYESRINAALRENSRLKEDIVPQCTGSSSAGIVKRRRFGRSRSAVLQEMEDFCTELANRPDLSMQQKDCLLSFLDKGYPMHLINKVMISTLSIDQMQKFIRIYDRNTKK